MQLSIMENLEKTHIERFNQITTCLSPIDYNASANLAISADLSPRTDRSAFRNLCLTAAAAAAAAAAPLGDEIASEAIREVD